MTAWIQSIAAVLITFGLVIFLHELGHFLMCLRLGVRVERFAFGFGPELLGVTHNGTRLSLCAFPLGGFVKPAGDNLEDITGEPNEYFSKPWHQRLVIVGAGPFMNYLLAFVLFFLVILVKGLPEPSKEPVVGDLAPGYPAAMAGVQVDDRVLRVGRVDVASWSQMAELIHASPAKPLELAIERAGVKKRFAVTPRLDASNNRGFIGIMPKVEYRPAGVLGAAREGVHQCWLWTAYTVKTLAQKLWRRERPDIAGPVGIVQMVGRAARSGLEDLVYLIGLISVAVGFFNLLPVPLLDGGHAVLYVWEGLSRRKLTVKGMAAANSVGMVLLVSLLLFATYNDLARIRAERWEKRAAQEAAVPAEHDPPARP